MLAAAVLSLLAAYTAHKMGRLSEGQREKVATIQRKRSEFELKELEVRRCWRWCALGGWLGPPSLSSPP